MRYITVSVFSSITNSRKFSRRTSKQNEPFYHCSWNNSQKLQVNADEERRKGRRRGEEKEKRFGSLVSHLPIYMNSLYCQSVYKLYADIFLFQLSVPMGMAIAWHG